ncbi:uncharacterized protein N7498_003999 [Penicillium cinerascens]|uniref:DUF7702 domain-containing protein n=1 Tax=Penicillium cinerascens TaxID=70096 RepID=A0A9W9N378_9EURO|nr:uncharacterized protein N7498_003999 [Penicillium cinerascens]KAJ5212353.1 hypothetical protein N7498_003999 [Penicillium cinerascens]
MSASIISRAADALISPGRRDIAIAEIVLFSIIHVTQIPLRYMQEWRYWHHDKRQSPGRCYFYSWWSMVGLLAQIRIASSAMILSTSHPNKSMFIAESALQNVGLSPLLFEVSLVLLACGQSGEFGPGKSKYSKPLRFALHGFRFPIVIAIVLAIVGGIIDNPTLGKVGSAILIVIFVFVCGLVVWLAVNSRSTLPVEGHHGILIVLLALPFLLIRIVYFLLLEYGSPKFNPATGSVSALAGMGLLMEIFVVTLLLTARAVAMPICLGHTKQHMESDDEDQAVNTETPYNQSLA